MEPASVIGLSFPEPAIEELVPAPAAGRPGAPPARSRASSSSTACVNNTSEDEIYRFRNLMIKDAVYASLLKRARATLHERFVTWAERVNRERGREQEFEEIHGYHLEQAYRYRTELGPIDAEGRAIAERAADKLANAGRRASSRGDMPAPCRCSSVPRRSFPPIPARLEILFDLGEA